MATNPSTLPENVGRITAPEPAYPYGSAKNDSTGTTGDGTPIRAPLMNDTYGFYQALLTRAGIVPSGVAETALNSQLLDAIDAIIAASASDTLNTVRIDVASATSVDLTANAPDTRHINITGTTTIDGFTVEEGKCYFVRFNAALTLTSSGSLVTQYGANIATVAGDTCIIRATADNVAEILCYTRNVADFPFTKVYESAELTWSSGGVVGPLPHLLGGFPKFITYEYRCIVADAGYAVGDRVFVNQPTGQSASDGLAVAGDATVLTGRWGSSRIGAFISKASGGITNLTSTSWRVVVKAYI